MLRFRSHEWIKHEACSEKTDVYNFKVVFFELISGMKAVDHNKDKRELVLADLDASKAYEWI
uniref:Serine-threonine/tyrosine-protein kinase catalytic domain-containing protein n=1 Tax=Nelumbo nucifera TaxID=4432 RepID=A0A822XS87_NELNU|nr:TPA_asm: hypothetical protein HUJ06_025928 [Nelumbo nucifera]